jgi:hypothetical protein
VWASMDASNVASTSVLKQAGLRFERRAVVDGLETHYYSLPRSAFQPVGQLLMLVEDRLTLPFLDIMEG